MPKELKSNGLFIASKQYHKMLRKLWNDNINLEYKVAIITPQEFKENHFEPQTICNKINDQLGMKADLDWYMSHLMVFKIGELKDFYRKE